MEYDYDAKGRLLQQTYEDGDTVQYRYDNSGALATVTDSATGITATYYYDFTDRLLAYEESATGYSLKVGYAYDTQNNLTGLEQRINSTAHTASYTYDEDNRITSVTADGVTVEYTYDAFGRVSQQVTKQGETTVLTESFGYTTKDGKTSAQIASYTTVTAAGSTAYSYTYDGKGNILSVSDGTNTTSYVYDSQNQLLRENNQAGNFTHTWEYDNAGNIQCRKEYAYTTGALGTPTDTVEYTYGDSSWGDLLTAYDGTAITYDEIGNPNAIGGWSFTWEHGRELASMSNGTATWTNTYNADGIRTQRTDGATTYRYIYTGSSLTQLEVGTDTLFFNYDASGTPLTVTYNGVTYYYATNLQGDIVAILDSTGATVVSYTYDAWGNPLSTTGTLAATLGTANPLRYRGYVYDTETGLYYLQSRYYDPEIGRFLNADGYTSTGQGFFGNNTFVYCGNNPIVFSDYGGNRYCAATTIAGESKEDRAASCAVQNEISRSKPKPNRGAAKPYTPNNSTETNCLGYVLGIDERVYAGDNNSRDFDLDYMVNETLIAVTAKGISIRPLDSGSAPIGDNEYRIALRVGVKDYHYMVEHSDGSWSHKPGALPSRLLNGRSPQSALWDGIYTGFSPTGEIIETGIEPNYYDSDTRFFAVTRWEAP